MFKGVILGVFIYEKNIVNSDKSFRVYGPRDFTKGSPMWILCMSAFLLCPSVELLLKCKQTKWYCSCFDYC